MDKSYRVLVADDFEIVRRIHTNHLKKCGITHIDEAKDGKDALDHFQSNQYDLIILDWYMPQASGYDVLCSIRKKGVQIPIIMCTDEVEESKLENAKKSGATEVIKKPYSPKYFREVINRLLP